VPGGIIFVHQRLAESANRAVLDMPPAVAGMRPRMGPDFS
jgi:hypothetical protein